jgi:hypothetical protein
MIQRRSAKFKLVRPIRIRLIVNKAKKDAVVEIDPDYDWELIGYHPGQEKEPFPYYVEPSQEELDTFSNSIVMSAASNDLPGYDVVQGSN